jgi:poly-gamma-glutamate capsule biosynthesis protein CapA/YwtB (metallophosphatase superfamily)
MITILVGADICPIASNVSLFRDSDTKALFNDLLPEFEAADLVIANLECPFIESPSPIFKTGPVFGESGDCINGIKAAGIDVLALANNHTMDHGEAGLRHTMEVCARAGIATVGAGENLAAARQMLIRAVNGIRIGILAMAEHEFSIARNGSFGANPLDLIEFVRNVKARRKDFDYLIVLFHGGDEFHVPSPRIRETCRFMVEMGADVVIVQHPHVLGGYESYQGGHIVYGQGALLMDEPIYRNLKSFHEGFLVKLSITSDATSTMEIIPFVQSDPAPGARRMDPEHERELRERLAKRNQSIQDDAFVEAEWISFCEQHKHAYLSGLLAHNRVVRKLNGNGTLTRLLHDKRALLGTRNIVCCETHREAVETIFNHKLV